MKYALQNNSHLKFPVILGAVSGFSKFGDEERIDYWFSLLDFQFSELVSSNLKFSLKEEVLSGDKERKIIPVVLVSERSAVIYIPAEKI